MKFISIKKTAFCSLFYIWRFSREKQNTNKQFQFEPEKKQSLKILQQKKILCHFERSFVSGKKRQNKVNIFMMIRNFACKFGVFCWANAIIDIKWKYLSFYFARGKLIFALNINQKNSKNFSKKKNFNRTAYASYALFVQNFKQIRMSFKTSCVNY